MPSCIETRSAGKTATYTVARGMLLVVCAWGGKRLLTHSWSVAPPRVLSTSAHEDARSPKFPLGRRISSELLLPVIDLALEDATLETYWSAALASALSGTTEYPVEGGRVDVSTNRYAIEVDRLEKWHEAIGQAAHYGLKTGKAPVVALMIPTDAWPLNEKTKSKLALIDETCTKQQIKLVLLRRLPRLAEVD